MKWGLFLVGLTISGLFVSIASGTPNPAGRTAAGQPHLLYGKVVGFDPAKVDSAVVLGGPLGNGDLPGCFGDPALEGWTTTDVTAQSERRIITLLGVRTFDF